MPRRKTTSNSSPSRSDLEKAAWEALISKEASFRYEKVPPGWIDYDQFAQKMGICREMAAVKLRQLARAGLCERKEFRVAWGVSTGGRTAGARLRPYFRLKK